MAEHGETNPDEGFDLTEEEYERVIKALSWNDGQGYDGDGPEDLFEPIPISLDGGDE